MITKFKPWLLAGALFTVLVACKSDPTNVEDKSNSKNEHKQDAKVQPPEKDGSEEDDTEKSPEEKKISALPPIDFAKRVAEKISQRDFNDWDEFSSSLVFYAPYAHIDEEQMIYLGASYMQDHYESDEVFTWGVQDGTGDSIKMTFHDYVDRYVVDFPLTEDRVIYKKVDKPQSRGNELHNVHEIFPSSIFVEIHKPADDEMGMNWRSLILVLEEIEGTLRLQGVVHNEWTI